jgi:hypothetical protein
MWFKNALRGVLFFLEFSLNVRSVQECLVLVQAAIKAQGVELMTARLQQFKETEEDGQTGVGIMLQCFQNMTEIDPEVPDALSSHSDLVSWLVSRVSVQKFPKYDENKGLAAQLLATLAQVCVLHPNPAACLCVFETGSLIWPRRIARNLVIPCHDSVAYFISP